MKVLLLSQENITAFISQTRSLRLQGNGGKQQRIRDRETRAMPAAKQPTISIEHFRWHRFSQQIASHNNC